MSGFASVLWAAVAALCAVGFGVVTGIVNSDEQVNGLWALAMEGRASAPAEPCDRPSA